MSPRNLAFVSIEKDRRSRDPSRAKLCDCFRSGADHRRVLSDQKAVLTVSNAVDRAQGMPELEGVWLSLLCIVERGVLEQTLALDLNPNERQIAFGRAEPRSRQTRAFSSLASFPITDANDVSTRVRWTNLVGATSHFPRRFFE